jgi:hypothetical protein
MDSQSNPDIQRLGAAWAPTFVSRPQLLGRPRTELDDGNWKNHDYDPEYHLTNPEPRRASGLVEIKRSWRAFANHAPMEQVLEGGRF